MLVQITMHLISGQDILKGTYTYTGFDDQKYKVPIERVYNFSQLHEGDHIAIKRLYGVYWHHAIIEDVETERGIINVIEYSNSAKEFSQDSSSPFKNPGIATVRRGKYSGLEDSLYLIKHKKYKPADTVVLRAKSRLGENKYDPLNNNCEHFALWCKTGISSSEQVENIEKTVRKSQDEIVKNALPLVARVAAQTASESGEEIVTTTVREMTKKVGTQTAAQQVVSQTVLNRGQQILKIGKQLGKQLGKLIAKEIVTQTAAKQVVSEAVSNGGQQILTSGTRETTKEFFSHTAKKVGEEIVTKGTRETAREVISQTTGTSAGKSLIGGTAYAVVFEGALAVYDIYCTNEDLREGKISQEEYNDAVGKRIVGGVGSVAGSTTGAVVGQTLIPFPVVGGFVGSLVGGMVGQLSANMFWNVVRWNNNFSRLVELAKPAYHLFV